MQDTGRVEIVFQVTKEQASKILTALNDRVRSSVQLGEPKSHGDVLVESLAKEDV